MGSATNGSDGIPLLVFTIFSAALFIFFLVRYEEFLEEKMCAPDTGQVWQVGINGIHIGEISESEEAYIRKNVFLSDRLWITWAIHFGKGLLLNIADFLVAIPMIIFWLAVIAMAFWPNVFALTFEAFQSMTPDQFVHGCIAMIPIVSILFLLFIAFQLIAGRNFGVTRCFDEAYEAHIRHNLNCAANGTVTVYRVKDGVFHYPEFQLHERRKPSVNLSSN
ncbi:MAG: hypothetical protein HYR92_02630 [Burkholderiales bacterium]|nr:hypothetical protein [Burkholderiales bacterium]